MRIAVASGKGGTGKTTVAVSLALSAPGRAALLDCDVEEPNAALFLKLNGIEESAVTVPVPVIDESACTSCGECARFCEFNAIVHIGTTVMVFPELCHSCGGCALVCPVDAIREEPVAIGTLACASVSRAGESSLRIIQGLLSIGNAMSPPVIRAVKDRSAAEQEAGAVDVFEIIDSPPGTSCPMGTAVTGADYVVLVTEPTPFGLHDLDLAVKTVRKMGIPFGVIVNRSDSGDDRVVRYCGREGIDLLLQIPEDRRIAEGYSRGQPLVESAPEYRSVFSALAVRMKTSARPASGGVQ
ncbi:ATP-binding protein [Treponema zuelzerae]|uniref:ATP-binding protein n=1 Tax=Teretinema zuelzerae TaxID=156 RepID=A0AAE3EGJ8_9SPIR|nr:ATP-binding protein [Teretinema zuelzerae]MCD1653790.1 ATP-binding protein [Teretinema zuelzerae]